MVLKTNSKMTKGYINIKMEIEAISNDSPLTFKYIRVPGDADNSASYNYNSAPQAIRRNIYFVDSLWNRFCGLVHEKK